MYNRKAYKHLNIPVWKGNVNKKGTNCSYENNVFRLIMFRISEPFGNESQLGTTSLFRFMVK